MLLYSNIYLTIFYSTIIIFLNFYIFKSVSKYLLIDITIAKIVFFNHLIFSTIFLLNDFFSLFDLTPGSDSISFYLNTEQKILFEKISFYPGHNFLYYLTFLLKKFYFDFFSMNFLFGFLGSLSILIFYGSVSKYLLSNFDKYAVLIFILIPSYNFWTSGISKDVLTALALSLMLLSFTKNSYKFLIFSIILLFFVRVHLGLLVILSLLASFTLFSTMAFFSKKEIYFYSLNFKKKYLLLFFSLLLILACFIINKFFYSNFINITRTIEHFQNMYPGHNFIEFTFFPLRVLEYLSRPYLWEENNFIIKILSLENILIISLLLIFGTSTIRKFSKNIKPKFYDLKLFLLIAIILIMIFQITLTSNVGIAMRQKWTFIPGLIFIFIYCKFYFISNKFNKNKEKQAKRKT
jgi:hypothetical protein